MKVSVTLHTAHKLEAMLKMFPFANIFNIDCNTKEGAFYFIPSTSPYWHKDSYFAGDAYNFAHIVIQRQGKDWRVEKFIIEEGKKTQKTELDANLYPCPFTALMQIIIGVAADQLHKNHKINLDPYDFFQTY